MTDSLSRVVYRTLVQTAPAARSPLFRRLWERAWSAAGPRLSGAVCVQLHGHPVVVNAGYAYPAFMRRWPTYNDPLVEVAYQAHLALGRQVGVVDVGAAVGDTVLLLMERCPGAIAEFHCVEGDLEFFGYLRRNLGHFEGVSLHLAMLSDRQQDEPELVRIHKGTASAVGDARREAVPLDSLLGGARVDVLKVDTDGFDGKVLAGASRLLSEQRPAVIFEWHPRLYEATGESWSRPFEVLSAAGYQSFVWFNKYGELSHVDCGYEPDSVAVLAEVCLAGRGPAPDWHYDVVALPGDSGIAPQTIAELNYARARRAGRVGR